MISMTQVIMIITSSLKGIKLFNRPVRIGDIVKLTSDKKGFMPGTVCLVKHLDVLHNKVVITNRKDYPITVKIQDIEIVYGPEWQIKLI